GSGFRHLLAVDVGLPMFLYWQRTISAKVAKTRHLIFRRRQLNFERLEDRCLLSGRPVALFSAAPLVAYETAKDLQTLSASNSLTSLPSEAQNGNMLLSVLPDGSNQAVQPISSKQQMLHAVN